MNNAHRQMLDFLKKREADLSLRQVKDKSHLVDFCSNDYLGFARSALLREKVKDEAERLRFHFNGATGSRLISGSNALYDEVETMVTRYHKAEAGLLFNSGYDANLGFFASVPQHRDLVLFDELVHASIRDGLKLTRATSLPFLHNDLADLELKMKGDYDNIFIAVESLFSMDGDFAPLKELVAICKKTGANLVVDEAHATGLFGQKGEGRVVELGLENDCFARIHTFGKTLGTQGAIVLGADVLKQFLVNFARPFIFSTALPFYTLISIKCAYDILSNSNRKVLKMRRLVDLFKQKMKTGKTAVLLPGESAIQSIIVPGNEKAIAVSQALEAAGFYAKAILYPTVARSKERIRICLHSFNTEREVIALTETLNRLSA